MAGVDGYLFIGDGANRWKRQYLGELTVVDAWKINWRNILAARQAQSQVHGVELWNFVAPEKQVVLPDKRWPGSPNRCPTGPRVRSPPTFAMTPTGPHRVVAWRRR